MWYVDNLGTTSHDNTCGENQRDYYLSFKTQHRDNIKQIDQEAEESNNLLNKIDGFLFFFAGYADKNYILLKDNTEIGLQDIIHHNHYKKQSEAKTEEKELLELKYNNKESRCISQMDFTITITEDVKIFDYD